MALECHNRQLKTDEYSIRTKHGKEFGYLNEYTVEGVCSICKTRVIEHSYQKFDKHKQLINRSSVYRGERASYFSSGIIHKEQRYKAKEVDKRMFLLYGEYGKTKKCYSNLSTMKLGLIDHTEGLRQALLV